MNSDHQDHLEHLLARDREQMRAEVDAVMHSGIARRIAATTPATDHPTAALRWSFAACACAVLIAVAAFVLLTVRKSVAPAAVMSHSSPAVQKAPAATIAQAEPTVPIQSHPSPTTQDVAPRHARAQRHRTTKPFPAPAALSTEERTLLALAQNDPHELQQLYQMQQQMNEEYEQRSREFRARVQAEEGENDVPQQNQ